jgi:hypothetical protein
VVRAGGPPLVVRGSQVSPRRQLALVVVGCAAGGVLALVAAGRPWEVVITPRPAPLPDLRTERTGADLWPWLPALAWVAVAGAGALLATRAVARQAVGGLLVLAGGGLVLAGAVGLGREGPVTGWPALAGLAGLAVAGAGLTAGLRGRRWPALAPRYQRPAPARRPSPDRQSGRDRPPGPDLPPPDRPDLLWDALDRGEDPTAR